MAAELSGALDLSNPRYWHQNAKLAVRDVFDALVELITNADDSYQRLGAASGTIEVEVERRRKGTPSVIRVRDFAEGMTAEVMRIRLGRVGDRVSGLSEGQRVRGTNSRGAKDVAVLGSVTFESIASDGHYHYCEITDRARFASPKSAPVTRVVRRQLGIPRGTGTLVTLSLKCEEYAIPNHEKLREQLGRLVVLRDIVSSPHREVLLKDSNQSRADRISSPETLGNERHKERFAVPGHPGAEAKIVIKRADRPLDNSNSRFREGGILVKSSHAIHEATLFAAELEHDPHAARFFGRLTCEYIETLWNDYDDRFERGEPATPANPSPIVDPLRKEGLRRDHPFVKALFSEALKRLRPLVEEERRQREQEEARIENRATRKRLRDLEREAAKFMNQYWNPEDPSRDPSDPVPDSQLRRKGFSLSPPFAQIVKGHSVRFWLNVSQEAFPEISLGDNVEIAARSDEIHVGSPFVLLEAHPSQPSVLRAVWVVRGEKETSATAVSARVGPIVAETPIEVLGSEKDRFSWVLNLCFGAKKYVVRTGVRKQIELLMPFVPGSRPELPVEVSCDHRAFEIHGEPILRAIPELGILRCRLRISARVSEARGTLVATTNGSKSTAAVVSMEPSGFTPEIKIKDKDFGNQRYFWRGTLLEIGARHPSLKRYLGPPPGFPGQEERHFRLLLAEIVAGAICERIISKTSEEDPQEFQDADWETYYAEYTKLLTEFLPIAHRTQVPMV